MEGVEEERTPFTDLVFTLVGTHTAASQRAALARSCGCYSYVVSEPRAPCTLVSDDPQSKITVLDPEIAAANAKGTVAPALPPIIGGGPRLRVLLIPTCGTFLWVLTEGHLPDRVTGRVSLDDYLQIVTTYCMYSREDILMCRCSKH